MEYLRYNTEEEMEYLRENAEVAGEVVGAHRFDLRRGRTEEGPHLLHELVLRRERVFTEVMTSDCKLKASTEGSK
jgi:hypothetical protein